MLIIDINDIFLGFEKYYSEMLLFTSWRDEWKELKPENAEACLEEYSKRQSRIDIIKGIIFPGEKALDLDDINPSDFEDNRPQHIFDTLDPQGEQENADDLDKAIRAKRDEVKERFEAEGHLMLRLRHPHIIQLLGCCPMETESETTASPLLVFEYLESGS